MAGWRDNLLEADLDGVQFHYQEVSNAFGRRVQVHEFPGRDKPYVDDLGRSARGFTIRAFLIGENYAATREELIAVLEAEGVKVFTHPYRGVMEVKVNGVCRMTERDDQGRYCEFSIPLIEAGEAFPTVNLLTPKQIAPMVGELNTALSETPLSVAGAIGAVVQSVINGVNRAASTLRRVNGKIGSKLNLIDTLSSSIDAYANEISTFINTPQRMLNELTQLGRSVMGLVKTFSPDQPAGDVTRPEPDQVKVVQDALTDTFAFQSTAEAIPTPTSQSEVEEDSHAALTRVFRASLLVSAAEQLVDLELSSSAQALEIAQDLDDKFDTVLQDPHSPEVLESLAGLRGIIVNHFTDVARALPRVTVVRVTSPIPALVLAYQVHGDSTKDQDIINRNNVPHPTFVPANVDLEVIRD